MSHPTTLFHPLLRILHWLMALAVLAMLFIGVAMVADISAAHSLLLAIHKPLGVVIALLVVVRIGLRRYYGVPAMPASVPGWQQTVAHFTHLALYLLMLAQPLVGWAMLSAGGFPVTIGEGLVLPPLLPASVESYAVLRPLHTLLAFSLFALILAHLAAALLHGLILRDGVLSSMTGLRRMREQK